MVISYEILGDFQRFLVILSRLMGVNDEVEKERASEISNDGGAARRALRSRFLCLFATLLFLFICWSVGCWLLADRIRAVMIYS